MSFPNKDTWLPRGDACLTYGDVGYDNSSRIELKRGHQWLMDTNGPELCSNKKQEMDPVMSCSWHDTSGFQSVSEQFTDLLFRSSPVRTANMSGRSIHSLGGEDNMGRKDFDDRYGSNSSMDLAMSHSVDVPSGCLNFGGIRKVKVNQVRDSNVAMSASMGLSFNGGENDEISLSCPYMNSDSNGISFTPTYSNVDKNSITNGSTFGKEDAKYIPVGQIFNEEDSNFISVGHNYTKGNDNILSIGQPVNKRDVDFSSVGSSYEKVDHHIISISPPYDKGPENFVTMPSIGRADENLSSVDAEHSRGDDNLGSIVQTFDKENTSIKSIGPSQERGDSNILSVGQSYNRIERNTISFGSYHDEPDTNPSGGIIDSYNLFIRNQNLVQGSEVACQKDLIIPNAVPNVNSIFKANLKTDAIPKNKEQNTSKKPPSNNFPSNVKSLLTTGMLDGVPVKYVSWSREKNLKGVIRGTGYLCSCLECNFAKVLNAYEFERHANCKTKHPNNHIYFENGKTIYAVVQELKNTPQEMLFDTIQNVTGSLINQKNFRAWKASYQAATRELQRIYGNDKLAFHLEPKISF